MEEVRNKQINVLEYWRAFESFLMPSVEHTSNAKGLAVSPKILTAASELPWPLNHKRVDAKSKESEFVFNVYVGLLPASLISHQIQRMLKDDQVYHEKKKNKDYTCLAGFVLDANGCLLKNSYVTPHYLISLFALENLGATNDWGLAYEDAKSKFESIKQIFESDALHTVMTFESIAKHLNGLVNYFGCLNDNNLSFTAVVHTKEIKAPDHLREIEINEFIPDFNEDEADPEALENYKREKEAKENEFDKRKKASLEIMPSFYLDDLETLLNATEKGNIGRAFEEYITDQSTSARQDVYQNRNAAKAWVSPEKLPLACWPSPNGNTLSFAQQLAVNAALNETSGLFSVNGPPGTGKTTLLRDIVANVIVERAKVLSSFTTPLDAFGVGILSNQTFKLKVTPLNEKLFGFEMVVAASNNNAVENISKELPKRKDIDDTPINESDENDFFSDVAKHLLSSQSANGKKDDGAEECWGLISAVLGNKSNIRSFFNTFFNPRQKNSMLYKLENWTLDDKEFEECVTSGKCQYNRDCEKRKRQDELWKKLYPEILQKWDQEKKEFNRILSEMKRLKQAYAKLEACYNNLAKLDKEIGEVETLIYCCQSDKEIHHSIHQIYNNDCQQSETEIKALNLKLKSYRDELDLYANHEILKRNLNDAQAHLNTTDDMLSKLKNKISDKKKEELKLKHAIECLEKNKKDIQALQPNILIQIIFFKSKWIKDCRAKVQAVIDEIIENRDDLYAVKNDLAPLLEEEASERSRHEQLCEELNNTKRLYQLSIKKIADLMDEKLLAREIEHALQLISDEKLNLKKIQDELNERESRIKHCNSQFLLSNVKINELKSNRNSILEDIARIRDGFFNDSEENLPDVEYWKQDDATLQLTSPWISKRLQALRSALFWSALRMHKYFILLARKKIISNIKALKWMLTDNMLRSEHMDHTRSMWASLFLIVPVVSSTFASIARLFEHTGKEEIGWLMIDEAGQTVPHNAAGAIWRSKRIIVVGDPMQVEPIVDLPAALSSKLNDCYKVGSLYDLAQQSTQTLSDTKNLIGTYLDQGNNPFWVGAPLVVHRRCVDPMFTTSNNIAYGGLMIQATSHPPSHINLCLKKSAWISLSGVGNDGNQDTHWIQSEGAFACYIITELMRKLKTWPSVYMITPFTSVEERLFNYIKSDHLKTWQELLPETDSNKRLLNVIRDSIGTIHRFQGKQAEVVILILGGNSKKKRAITWASSKPNILNVAITRAKKFLYVIGNAELWGSEPNFCELKSALEPVNNKEEFDKHAFVQAKNFQREMIG